MNHQIVSIDQLFESPLNPRKHFDQGKLAELAASMVGVGIIAPLVVRQAIPAAFSTSDTDVYEVVDGARRLRAAKLAGVTKAPVVIRDLDDVQALELMMIAANQHDDVHPLEEAQGYAALMHASGCTVEAIALKVGKSSSHVYKSLKLLQLTDEAQKAFYAEEITIAHAVRLARLTPDQQATALRECYVEDLFHRDSDRREPAPVSRLDAWIAAHVREQVRAEDTPHYFPELIAAVEQLEAAAPDAKLLELSESHHVSKDLGTKKHGAIGRNRWTPIRGPQDRCAHVQRGVVVHGGPMRVLDVCATKGCPKHFPVRESTPGRASHEDETAWQRQREADEARQRKTEEERQAWEKLQPKALQAFSAHIAKLPVTPELVRLVIGSYRVQEAIKLTGPLTAKNVGQVLAMAFVLGNGWNRETFLRAVKPFKFNLGHVEQQAEKKAAPKAQKQATAAKAVAKKPAPKKKPAAKPQKKGRRS